MKTNVMLTAFIISTLAGCATPNQVARPTDISLDQAITSVADSLYSLQTKTNGRDKIGLIVDEATVEFTIAASANNTTTTGATISAIQMAGGEAGLSVSNELVNTGTRGNTIKITFKNIATADYSKGGKEMAEKCAKNSTGCPKTPMKVAPAKTN